MKLPPTTDSHTIERAFRVRLQLKPEQARMLNRLMGAKRKVWNWALELKETAWRENKINLTGVDISREFTKLRHAPETAWLSGFPPITVVKNAHPRSGDASLSDSCLRLGTLPALAYAPTNVRWYGNATRNINS